MRAGLTIGEFATLSHLSVRTLRRYHEAGLLEPAAVDPFTGYRYYAAEQIPPAQVIHRLRELDVPLAEVKAILATGDPQRRAELITGHLQRLEDNSTGRRLPSSRCASCCAPARADLHVEVRSVPARTVATISGHMPREEMLRWYDDAMAELDAAFPAADRTGPPGGRYANELFTEGAGT